MPASLIAGLYIVLYAGKKPRVGFARVSNASTVNDLINAYPLRNPSYPIKAPPPLIKYVVESWEISTGHVICRTREEFLL